MNSRPLLYDVFCGAGGAGMGYHRAGFEVIGVDNKPQKNYPFEFIQMDALEFLQEVIDGTRPKPDAIHASPPCQFATMASRQWRKEGREYPNLIEPTRRLLKELGQPFVIENVPGAPLINPVILNGTKFNMRLRRVRLFECSFEVPFFFLPPEEPSGFRMGRPVKKGGIITPVGHFSNVSYARKVMEIDWMAQGELAQAIPPAYTEFIGKQLIQQIKVAV